MINYVCYYRTSTAKQTLSVDAQRLDIETYLNNYSDSPYKVIGEFVEVVTGKDNGREKEQREAAIALARKHKAILLVSRLDRLGRDVEQIAGIMKRVQLKVAQMPHADKFQLHIFAALAEQEREFISVRTKAALRQAKANGKRLGGLRDKTNERNKVRRQQATEAAEKLSALMEPMVKAGYSLQAMADSLNNSGITTRSGGQWYPMSVKRVVDRLPV